LFLEAAARVVIGLVIYCVFASISSVNGIVSTAIASGDDTGCSVELKTQQTASVASMGGGDVL
jgi:hypothetical protein